MLSQTPSSVTGCSGACWQEKGHFWEKNKLDIEAPTATKTIFFVASDSNWSQCKAVLSEMEFPFWEHSRVIPLECFFPPSTTTPWFFLCLFTYLNTSCLSKGSCLPTKKNPICTKPSISRWAKTTKATPACSKPLSETSSRSDVDLMPWPVWGEHRLHFWLLQVLWTATEHWHRGKGSTEIGIKLVHSQQWDHNPCSTLKF